MKLISNNNSTFTILTAIGLCVNLLAFIQGVDAARRYLRVRNTYTTEKEQSRSLRKPIATIKGEFIHTSTSTASKTQHTSTNKGFKLEGAYVLKKTIEQAWNENSHKEIPTSGFDLASPSSLSTEYDQSMPPDHFVHTPEITLDPLSERIQSESVQLAFGVKKNATKYHLLDGSDLYQW